MLINSYQLTTRSIELNAGERDRYAPQVAIQSVPIKIITRPVARRRQVNSALSEHEADDTSISGSRNSGLEVNQSCNSNVTHPEDDIATIKLFYYAFSRSIKFRA